MTASPAPKPRFAYMDALRLLAAYLVVVNHTNSGVFQHAAVGAPAWWLSMARYCNSKLAVPLFVALSGACLLGRVDGYRKAGWRFLRVALAMLLFSYLFFLYDAWVYYGLWPRAADFGAFFARVWRVQILDDYWYVFLYLGLMLMLPLMQRLASAMKSRDMLYLIGVSFGLNALWPLAAHYVPALEWPPYFDAPMFSVFVGLFFAGYWLNGHVPAGKKTLLVGVALLLFSVAAPAALQYAESFRAERYWFMDERTQPSVFAILGALSAMAIAKTLYARPLTDRRRARLRELGGCAFGVYLWQGFWVVQTQDRVFAPLAARTSPLLAALLWGAGIFALSLALTWLMRRVPLLKKLL